MDAQRKLKARRSTFFAPPVCGSLPSVAVVLEVRASPIAPRRGEVSLGLRAQVLWLSITGLIRNHCQFSDLDCVLGQS